MQGMDRDPDEGMPGARNQKFLEVLQQQTGCDAYMASALLHRARYDPVAAIRKFFEL